LQAMPPRFPLSHRISNTILCCSNSLIGIEAHFLACLGIDFSISCTFPRKLCLGFTRQKIEDASTRFKNHQRIFSYL
jgi:hypothetical protein